MPYNLNKQTMPGTPGKRHRPRLHPKFASSMGIAPPPFFSLCGRTSRGLSDNQPSPPDSWFDESPVAVALKLRGERLERSLYQSSAPKKDISECGIPTNAKIGEIHQRAILGEKDLNQGMQAFPGCAPSDALSTHSQPLCDAFALGSSLDVSNPGGVDPAFTTGLSVEGGIVASNPGALAPISSTDLGIDIPGINEMFGSSLTPDFISGTRYLTYDPRNPTPTSSDIVMRLGQIMGPGVTKAETRQILRRCKSCRRFMLVDRCGVHRCNGETPNINAGGFHLGEALLSESENSGLTQNDLISLLSTCNACCHIVMTMHLGFHLCLGFDYH
ncbi:hypothetical protein FA13DRAFT_1798653 [Coprinellus micaceus]|uniref:Uncharacterized protein n=1 Tax=Coprinellus micaceus TaxID=71717 RepID=A0A4Y7SM26_COPMI|nr:hypothetical protein FA13DRAFT_1798653 [Coprinellus micaceus]